MSRFPDVPITPSLLPCNTTRKVSWFQGFRRVEAEKVLPWGQFTPILDDHMWHRHSCRWVLLVPMSATPAILSLLCSLVIRISSVYDLPISRSRAITRSSEVQRPRRHTKAARKELSPVRN